MGLVQQNNALLHLFVNWEEVVSNATRGILNHTVGVVLLDNGARRWRDKAILSSRKDVIPNISIESLLVDLNGVGAFISSLASHGEDEETELAAVNLQRMLNQLAVGVDGALRVPSHSLGVALGAVQVLGLLLEASGSWQDTAV